MTYHNSFDELASTHNLKYADGSLYNYGSSDIANLFNFMEKLNQLVTKIIELGSEGMDEYGRGLCILQRHLLDKIDNILVKSTSEESVVKNIDELLNIDYGNPSLEHGYKITLKELTNGSSDQDILEQISIFRDLENQSDVEGSSVIAETKAEWKAVIDVVLPNIEHKIATDAIDEIRSILDKKIIALSKVLKCSFNIDSYPILSKIKEETSKYITLLEESRAIVGLSSMCERLDLVKYACNVIEDKFALSMYHELAQAIAKSRHTMIHKSGHELIFSETSLTKDQSALLAIRESFTNSRLDKTIVTTELLSAKDFVAYTLALHQTANSFASKICTSSPLPETYIGLRNGLELLKRIEETIEEIATTYRLFSEVPAEKPKLN
jgi:hypothetical protein